MNDDFFDNNGGSNEERVNEFFNKLRNNSKLSDLDGNGRTTNLYSEPTVRTNSWDAGRTGTYTPQNRSSLGDISTTSSGEKKYYTKSSNGMINTNGSGRLYSDRNGNSNGKNSKNSKNGKKSKKEKRPWWKVVLKAALYMFSLLAVTICILSVVIAIYLNKETVGDEELLDLRAIKLSYATQYMVMNDETGEWEEYDRIYGDENRIWVDYKDMPDDLVQCTIASEDHNFEHHNGVDIKRTAGAMTDQALKAVGLPGLYSNTQGGSTITQQLVKNITDDDATTIPRKIREIYRAYQLEKRFSKDEIMEAYLNTIALGSNTAGIESAANYYFGVTTKDLTVAQSAALICITKSPTAYNPYLYPDANKYQREDVVLYAMRNEGMLTEEEYRAARAESETFNFDEPAGTMQRASQVTSYFTDTAHGEVLRDLVEIAGYSEEEASELYYKGGLRVYLTMDKKVQEVVEDVAVNGDMLRPLEYEDIPKDELPLLDEDGEEVLDEDGKPVTKRLKPEDQQPQSAIVVMDYEGNLKGIAGGIREKTHSRGLNRAIEPRQTGSAMKPLGAYCLGIEFNYFTYSTAFYDGPVRGNWPANYNNSYAEADVTVAEAIRVSLNTTAVQAMEKVGAPVTYDFLENGLGISTLDEDDKSTGPLALGGMTYGVSPYEMCAAYQVFGNDGTYYEPHAYSRVENSRGEVIIDKTAKLKVNYKVISPETSMIMNRLLQLVVMGGGTGSNAKPRINPANLPYAGKTGTTSNLKDYWFMGMNPYYVCAVWEGYDEPRTLKLLEPKPIQLIFREVMGRICEDLPYKNFPVAPGVSEAAYCKETGELASGGCKETGLGFYKDGNMPPPCYLH